MNLKQTIRKVLNESSGNMASLIEKLLNRQVKERYPRFVCRIEVIPPGNESFYVSGEKTKKFIVRVVFKPLPDGEWVARDYRDKAMDECWDLVHDFMGIPVDVYSKHDPNCGQDTMIGINESTFLKRRVNAEILEKAISDALNYAIFRFGEKYNRNLNQFTHFVMAMLMDHLRPTLSNWGFEEFPYDEIYEFLKEKYHDRIYNEYLKLRNIEPTKLEIIESRFLKRRINPEGFDASIKDALDYVSSKFYNKKSSWYRADPEIFRRLVINIMMDHLHPTLSNWGTEDFPYDEVYNFLTDYYSQRILERYKELDENPPIQMETNESEITERCWKGYTQKGMKTMFGKRYPNCVKKTKK